MTKQEKKAFILNELAREGEKRSYNEIAADLELYRWTLHNKGEEWMKQKGFTIKGNHLL